MKTVHIVKIGSDSIEKENLEKLLQDIAKYEAQNQERFLIISSWAVKLWKEQVKKSWWHIGDFSSASLASLGQQYLMQIYDKLSWDKLVSQVLLDDSVNHEYIQNFLKKFHLDEVARNFASKILRPC